MEPDPENFDWLDQIQTGRVSSELTDRLRTELRRTPREAARLEDELALNALLKQLPDAPVPSNFPARVIAEIGLQEGQIERDSRTKRWWNFTRLFRPAVFTALVALALTGWWQFQLHERQALAESVSAVSRTAAFPGLEVLQDFEAIRLLRTSSQPGDLELIAALATP